MHTETCAWEIQRLNLDRILFRQPREIFLGGFAAHSILYLLNELLASPDLKAKELEKALHFQPAAEFLHLAAATTYTWNRLKACPPVLYVKFRRPLDSWQPGLKQHAFDHSAARRFQELAYHV